MYQTCQMHINTAGIWESREKKTAEAWENINIKSGHYMTYTMTLQQCPTQKKTSTFTVQMIIFAKF